MANAPPTDHVVQNLIKVNLVRPQPTPRSPIFSPGVSASPTSTPKGWLFPATTPLKEEILALDNSHRTGSVFADVVIRDYTHGKYAALLEFSGL